MTQGSYRSTTGRTGRSEQGGLRTESNLFFHLERPKPAVNIGIVTLVASRRLPQEHWRERDSITGPEGFESSCLLAPEKDGARPFTPESFDSGQREGDFPPGTYLLNNAG